jgi:hypothetical protein
MDLQQMYPSDENAGREVPTWEFLNAIHIPVITPFDVLIKVTPSS